MRLRLLARRVGYGVLGAAVLAGGVFGYSRWERGRLPYHDGFAEGRADGWRQFGGAWHIRDGVMYNRSDERGAKLLTGSERWTDYQLDADVRLIGHEGEVGVVVRATDAERGIDSYNGYYVGLRSSDSGLVIGRADHGWSESQPVAVDGSVKTGPWYRLHVVAVGCNIGASATNVATGATTYDALHENDCARTGAVGLRSWGTGGAWRNVSVRRATDADWTELRSHVGRVEEPVYPEREADYSRMREAYFRKTYTLARDSNTSVEGSGAKSAYRDGFPTRAAYGDADERRIVPMEDLRKNIRRDETVVLRGVVTSSQPLFIQDATGGVAVDTLQHPSLLNLGDEVEVTGKPISTGVSPIVEASNVRLLWDRTQAVPLSISSTQAASGAFASALVGVEGTLVGREKETDGQVKLHLEDASQRFTAYVSEGVSSVPLSDIKDGSLLRLRGVCDLSSRARNDGAFAIRLRSMDDIEVLSGPPFWTGERVAQAMVALAVLIALSVWMYLRLERWKMRAIMGERERLAHEMHDTLAQSFAGVGFHLQGVRNTIRGGTAQREAVLEKLDVACDLVKQTHRDASANIAALHPDADEGRDLLVALQRALHAMLEGDDLPLTMVREGEARPISYPVRDALFQVGREAITNVLRHSGASGVWLKLRYDAKTVTLEVKDDGRGFAYDPNSMDFGIRTMQRRVAAIDGVLDVDTRPGEGVTISVRSPYGRKFTFGDWLRAIRHSLAHRGV